MLTKKNLWYLTLFSIFIVLAAYYISFPNEKKVAVAKDNSEPKNVVITKTSELTAMRATREEEHEKQVNEVKNILNDSKKTIDERNDAYEALKTLNANKSMEEALEKQVKKDFGFDVFIKIDSLNIKCVVESKENDYKLANKIMNNIQNKFEEKKYITVTFQDK